MAVVAATKKFRVNAGNKWIEGWDVTGNLAADAEDEWVATTLQTVDLAWFTPRGNLADSPVAGLSVTTAVQLNAQGTGVAEGTNPGDVGIEVGAALTTDGCLLVIGE
jgi:hypothetical protein